MCITIFMQRPLEYLADILKKSINEIVIDIIKDFSCDFTWKPVFYNEIEFAKITVGIYILIVHSESDGYQIYVGQSSSINDRLIDHLNKGERSAEFVKDKDDKTFIICKIEEKKRKSRCSIEQLVVDQFIYYLGIHSARGGMYSKYINEDYKKHARLNLVQNNDLCNICLNSDHKQSNCNNKLIKIHDFKGYYITDTLPLLLLVKEKTLAGKKRKRDEADDEGEEFTAKRQRLIVEEQ